MNAGIKVLLLGAAALSGAACKDDPKKASVSAQTSWQIGCVPGGAGCGTSRDAHRGSEDDLEIGCSRDGDTFTITLTDPGQDATSVGVRPRSYSRLRITRLDPEQNRCSVEIQEEERETGGTLRLLGNCGDDLDDPCRVSGELDEDGWDFDGTIVCEGLRVSGEGPPIYRLQAAGTSGEPAVVQVANCR